MSATHETQWWPLWRHMREAHGLTLVCDECRQIAAAVDESRAAQRTRPVLRDDDGVPIGAGDQIRFCYGIPGRIIIAEVIERGGSLIALTPGHDPAECKLRGLRGRVGMWYKHNSTL